VLVAIQNPKHGSKDYRKGVGGRPIVTSFTRALSRWHRLSGCFKAPEIASSKGNVYGVSGVLFS
ncbi:MAG: hypothetical protein ABIQ87_14770, partial [Rubrivivax sp.]